MGKVTDLAAPAELSRAPGARAPAPDPAAVLTKAVLRAGDHLGLTQKEVARILGVSDASVSRMHGGAYLLSPSRAKEWELGTLFVRMFRALDALWGHGEEARAWLASPNLALGDRPRALLVTVEGLVRVVAYLDAARGRV
jgi:uncharacterized protein (DUF2384 family)